MSSWFFVSISKQTPFFCFMAISRYLFKCQSIIWIWSFTSLKHFNPIPVFCHKNTLHKQCIREKLLIITSQGKMPILLVKSQGKMVTFQQKSGENLFYLSMISVILLKVIIKLLSPPFFKGDLYNNLALWQGLGRNFL